MAGVKGTKPYTEKEFETVKKLTLMPELTQADVARITGRSTNLISNTTQAKNWSDYKNLLLEKQRKYENRHGIVKKLGVTENVEATPEVTKNSFNDQRVISSIESIASSLEVIASHLQNEAPLNRIAKESRLFGWK